MSGLPVKRSLFQTPSRPSKRSRGAKTPRRNSQVMRVPAYLKPETKQFKQTALATSLAPVYYTSIATSMTQGDASNEFIGAKFRMTRLRVYYDYSGLTLTRGIRISVIIPKRTLTFSTVYTEPWDTTDCTVLYDMLLPNDPSVLAGTFDVPGPVNVHMDPTGTTVEKNDVIILINSDNASARTQTTYTMWYTDA